MLEISEEGNLQTDRTNQLEMDRNALLEEKKALLEEKEKLKEWSAKVNNRVDSLQQTAFQLANYYFVSQAVVFTALAGNSALVCHDVWFPLVLSLVPALLNLFALGMIGSEYRKAINFREENASEMGNNNTMLENNKKKLDNKGEQLVQINATPARSVIEVMTTKCFYACMIAFSLFAIVIAFGSVWILCGEKIIAKLHHA